VAGVTRAILVREFGGPEVLVPAEVPDPEPGPGDAVIEMAAADVLFIDTLIRAGRAVSYGFPHRPPYIPGGGAAGRLADGRPVVARTGPPGANSGSYSERIIVPAQRLVPVPDAVDLTTAAGLLHDGPTALGLAEATGVKPGDNVLIVGAAGGAALVLAQLAAEAGGRVIGAARLAGAPPDKARAILGVGAELAVDYGSPDWASRVLDGFGGAGPDVVFDGVGGELGRAAFEITAEGGRFCAYGVPGGGFARISDAEAARRGVTVLGLEQIPPGRADELLPDVLARAAAGRLRPVIAGTFPLDRAADAHAAMAARTVTGRLLLTP
jgi:NADPH2:quinone reductase